MSRSGFGFDPVVTVLGLVGFRYVLGRPLVRVPPLAPAAVASLGPVDATLVCRPPTFVGVGHTRPRGLDFLAAINVESRGILGTVVATARPLVKFGRMDVVFRHWECWDGGGGGHYSHLTSWSSSWNDSRDDVCFLEGKLRRWKIERRVGVNRVMVVSMVHFRRHHLTCRCSSQHHCCCCCCSVSCLLPSMGVRVRVLVGWETMESTVVS